MSEKNNICLATDGAEKCAEEPKIRSIAFPGPGKGVGGLSSKEVAIITLSALKEHINEGTTLHEVIFVAFAEELADTFKDIFEQILI